MVWLVLIFYETECLIVTIERKYLLLWRGHMVPHSMKCRQHCFMAELYPATNCDTLWYSSGTLVNWNLRLPLVVDGHVGKQVE